MLRFSDLYISTKYCCSKTHISLTPVEVGRAEGWVCLYVWLAVNATWYLGT